MASSACLPVPSSASEPWQSTVCGRIGSSRRAKLPHPTRPQNTNISATYKIQSAPSPGTPQGTSRPGSQAAGCCSSTQGASARSERPPALSARRALTPHTLAGRRLGRGLLGAAARRRRHDRAARRRRVQRLRQVGSPLLSAGRGACALIGAPSQAPASTSSASSSPGRSARRSRARQGSTRTTCSFARCRGSRVRAPVVVVWRRR